MMTLTAPHSRRQSLPTLLSGMNDAFRTMLNRCSWKRIAREIGVVGKVRALEVDHGSHGWHVHFHVLLFVSGQISNVASLTELLLPLWQSACIAARLQSPNDHGLMLDQGSEVLAHYACKWAVESVNKTNMTKSRKDRSPFDLLRDFGNGDRVAGSLFREYAHSIKGLRQLSWSKGLRKRLNLGQERTDKQISDVDTEETFLPIPVPIWKLIVRNNMRSELLARCRLGKEAAFDFLIELWQMYSLRL